MICARDKDLKCSPWKLFKMPMSESHLRTSESGSLQVGLGVYSVLNLPRHFQWQWGWQTTDCHFEGINYVTNYIQSQ